MATRRADAALEVKVAGRLDGRTGQYLVEMVDQMTAIGDTVTIDLSMVVLMDSDGAEAVSRAASIIAAKSSIAAFGVEDEEMKRLLQRQGLLGSGGDSRESQPHSRRRPISARTPTEAGNSQ